MTLASPTLRDEITANMRAAKARMWVRIKGGNRELTHYIAEVVLPVAGLVFLLTVISLYGLGMVFASLYMLYGREAWHTNMLLQEPVFFLSGSYFPTIYVSVIPVWLQVTATLIPMTVGLDAIRRVTIQGQGLMAVWPHILALIAFIAILMPVARMALNYMENLGKREGRLTLRWQ